MIISFIKNILHKFSTTNKPKIIPKIENTDDRPEEIFSVRYDLFKRRSQIGNLITYRRRNQSNNIYSAQQEELKEEPHQTEEHIDVNNTKFKDYTIKVKIEVIKENENQEIIEKYNKIKPLNWPPLEMLQRAEGGYQLEIPEKKNMKGASQNEKIKQLRWMNKTLICRSCYTTFNEKEIQLLYRAMHSVLGDNVYME